MQRKFQEGMDKIKLIFAEFDFEKAKQLTDESAKKAAFQTLFKALAEACENYDGIFRGFIANPKNEAEKEKYKKIVEYCKANRYELLKLKKMPTLLVIELAGQLGVHPNLLCPKAKSEESSRANTIVSSQASVDPIAEAKSKQSERAIAAKLQRAFKSTQGLDLYPTPPKPSCMEVARNHASSALSAAWNSSFKTKATASAAALGLFSGAGLVGAATWALATQTVFGSVELVETAAEYCRSRNGR